LKKIIVAQSKLLDTLKANKEKHLEMYEKARVAYRQKVIEEITIMQSYILEDQGNDPILTDLNGLQAPVDMTSDYDEAIAMVEWSTENAIELSRDEFRQYVMDDWAWKSHALLANTRYVN